VASQFRRAKTQRINQESNMSFFNTKSVTAKRVGDNLVASFASATPPLVWKFDLERNHSFTIALQGEAGDWELGITSPKGEFYPIAHFPAKEDAEDALDKVQKVLMKKKRTVFATVLRWAFGLGVIAFILFCLFGYFSVKSVSSLAGLQNNMAAGMPGAVMPTAPSAPAVFKPGVPLSADDVLQPPR
jgi:hypothetical protein